MANNSRSKQNKKKNLEHPFVYIDKEETCAKFQQKLLNSVAVRALQSFQLSR